jgi:hypothetical protein
MSASLFFITVKSIFAILIILNHPILQDDSEISLEKKTVIGDDEKKSDKKMFL